MAVMRRANSGVANPILGERVSVAASKGIGLLLDRTLVSCYRPSTVTMPLTEGVRTGTTE